MCVFISYSFDDKEKFDDVCFAFEHKNITPWKNEIAAGEELRERLRSAIESCAVCVFIATQNSLASGWCQAEIGAFWGAGKPVVVYLADNKLTGEKLPEQFQPDKWAATTREVVNSVKSHLRAATDTMLVGKRPANAFWLGHDLARAIQVAKFEPDNRAELDKDLRQALHHLDEIGLGAPDARKLLLSALKTHRIEKTLSEERREELVRTIARAKNELGDRISRTQLHFIGYPTIEAQTILNKKLDDI